MVDPNSLIDGDILQDIETKKTYDYGYLGQDGHVICYYEGERNMQDSIAIKPELLIRVKKHAGSSE